MTGARKIVAAIIALVAIGAVGELDRSVPLGSEPFKAFAKKKIHNLGTIHAQSLPYTLVVVWDVETTAASYNCYLDNAVVVTGVTATTCSFPVATKGAHTVGVTAVNPIFVPSESAQAQLAFTLAAPNSPKNIKVK